jgi:hypothetical protein
LLTSEKPVDVVDVSNVDFCSTGCGLESELPKSWNPVDGNDVAKSRINECKITSVYLAFLALQC